MLIYNISRVIHVIASRVWPRQTDNTDIPRRDASFGFRHYTRNNTRGNKAWRNSKGRKNKETCFIVKKGEDNNVIYEEYPDQIVVKTVTLGGKRK